MPDFTDKMHQIRFWLRLLPRPKWGAHCTPPDLQSWQGEETVKELGEKGSDGKRKGNREHDGKEGNHDERMNRGKD